MPAPAQPVHTPPAGSGRSLQAAQPGPERPALIDEASKVMDPGIADHGRYASPGSITVESWLAAGPAAAAAPEAQRDRDRHDKAGHAQQVDGVLGGRPAAGPVRATAWLRRGRPGVAVRGGPAWRGPVGDRR